MRLGLCLLVVALTACRHPWMDPERDAARTEVVVVPIPRGPEAPPAIGPSQVAALVRAARPERLLVEVPRADWDRVEAAVVQDAPDPWLEHMSEVRILIGVAARLRIPVQPASGWTPEVGAAWRAFAAEGYPNDPFVERAVSHRRRRDERDGDDPDWVLSTARSEVVAWEAATLESASPHRLGAAAPSRVAAAHVAVVRAIVASHPGERIVVAIDARYARAIERALLGEARIVSPRAFIDAID